MFSKLFTKILVPYDGSSHSKKAVSRAMEVAHNLDSEIFLFNVVNVSYISPPGMLQGLTRSKSEKSVMKKWEKSVIKETEKMLQSETERCKSAGLSAKYFVTRGNVSKEILDFAKKRKITIIVIGSQGLHGVSKLKSLGSVSRRISEQAHCPVLIVR